jgi:hypothetical protein
LAGVYDCKDIPAELKPGQTLSIVGSQTIGEIYQTHADGTCEKTLSEHVTITSGSLKFSGDSSMTVYPIDVKDCSTVK